MKTENQQTMTGRTIRESDIAVVGMACRFPGARNTDEFWRNVRNGVESIEFLTDEQLIASGVDPEKTRDPAYVKARASLADIEMFDAGFFGLSQRDAAIMDPQHRHFLECTYECLENAGHTPRWFDGSIGVFAGSGCNLYLIHNLFSNPELIEEHGFFQIRHTGNDKDFLVTRLSYCLNLTGPSVNIQTACSTSLVAIHTGCQSLLSGECDLALSGGVTIDVTMTSGYRYQEGEVLSPDGHCRAFDHRSRGTVFGSGVGVVALRRLADALDDGDTIHAVVKGSAINNDGSAKVGYLAPSVEGQYHAVMQALGVAELPAESITYMEAHGTGTIVGDPIEVRALTEAFRTQTDRRGFCALGSVKTNIGHLDTAAGAASFIKVVESLKHRELPPSLHFEKPNPAIDFEQSPFYVNDKLQNWAEGSYPLRAAVNSLAVGGTNAHVILEEAPPPEASGSSRPWQLLVLSARSAAALDAAAANLTAHLEARSELNLGDVAFTLQTGRSEFEHRRMLVSGAVEDAVDSLETNHRKRVFSSRCTDEPCEVVFMLTGQGAQYAGMAAEIYRSEPAFRSIVDRCSGILLEHLGLDLASLLFEEKLPHEEVEARLRATSIAQPALFVLEYALAKLWIEWGVRPSALIGHSIGEYAAACLAEVLSLDDALALVAARGRLMQAAPAGSMLAVKTGEQELSPWLGDVLSLAAVNSPSSSVVSGPDAEIEALEKRLRAEGIECTRLRTSHAFHSAMMDGVLEPFSRQCAAVRLSPPKIPFISNLTGSWISTEDATDPRYWARHLRQPVRFADGLSTLLDGSDRLLLEVGPGTTLSTLARQHPSKGAARGIVSSLPHARDRTSDGQALLTAVGHLWLCGVEIDWKAFHAHERRRRIPLPTYPFEHKRCWIEERKKQPEAKTSAQPAVASGRQEFEDWFWKPVWKRTERPEGTSGQEAARWLVFADDSPLSSGVLTRFRERLDDATADERIHRLELENLGELDSFKLRSRVRSEPRADQVEIQVHTAGLNFRDVLIALGAYPDAESATMGCECAGVITRVGEGVTDLSPGDEVVANAPGFQTHVTIGSSLVAPKPPGLSFEEAVTVPLGFMTAHYSLCHVGKLSKGERVLIHAATGGVGLSAVQIARRQGAEIFATAGSPVKRDFLHSLGIEHVFDSRSLDFADRVLEATGGEGVDVVLNSLAGEFLVKGLAILRPLGRFLEIGKSDIYSNNPLGLEPFKKNISFCSIDLEVVGLERPDFFRTYFRELMAEFTEGRYKPLPFKVFPLRKASDAFEHMAKARHIGKIVLTIEPDPSSVVTVVMGAGFRQLSDSEYEIDPRNPEDYRTLISRLEASGRAPDRVLHLWSARQVSCAGIGEDALRDFEVRSFYSLLYAAQAIAEAGLPHAIRMAVASVDTHSVSGEADRNPLGALALGPARVIPRELENVSCVSVDLESRPTGANRVADLISELEVDPAHPVIAYREGGRFVQTFEPITLKSVDEQTVPLRPKGVYVITGGFGGMGLVFARHLAENYQARLVLIGRTALPPREEWEPALGRGGEERQVEMMRAVTELESLGAEVMVASVNVADEARLRSVIEAASRRFGTINGVLHAAGHIDDAPIVLKTLESAESVLEPKVKGTLVLQRALADLPLDFFALFSSDSSITAPAGQVDYVAANSFLNALAGHAAAGGDRRVIAIDWGAWREVGMAVRALEEQAAKRSARRRSSPECAHPLIERCAVNGSDEKVYSTYPLGSSDWLLGDHRLRDGEFLLPGTGYLELIRAALAEETHGDRIELRDVVFRAPFSLQPSEHRSLQIALQKKASGWDVLVSSGSGANGDRIEHVTASAALPGDRETTVDSLREIRERCSHPGAPGLNGNPLLEFGPRWQNLKELHFSSEEALAVLELPEGIASDVKQFRLHPALVDIAVGCGFPLIHDFDPEVDSYVPFACERLVARGPLPAKVYSHVRYRVPRKKGKQLSTFDVALMDERGDVVVEIGGFNFKRVVAADLTPEHTPAAGSVSSGNILEDAVREGITSAEGVEAFRRILQGEHLQVVVSPAHLLHRLEDRQVPGVAEEATGMEPTDGLGDDVDGDDVDGVVIGVLKKALGVESLSPEDDFFQMGGDSLSAMRVATQLKNRFSVSLPIGVLFESPTAAELAAVLKEELDLATRGEADPLPAMSVREEGEL